MEFKINNSFLLIILILLQSCSGGRIGNFLESSFKNIEEPKIKNAKKQNLQNQVLKKSNENGKDIKNIEEPKIKNAKKQNLQNQILKKSNENGKDSNNIKELKIKETSKKNLQNKLVIKSEERSINNKKITKKKMSLQKRNYEPQSYKIIFILKDVDPKDPIEDLSTILRNSDVNFEIEKIERFFDSKNKSIKRK